MEYNLFDLNTAQLDALDRTVDACEERVSTAKSPNVLGLCNANEAKMFWNWVYAHGTLESELGSDLIGSDRDIPETGIHPGTCKGQPVLIFIWENTIKIKTGLVVRPLDGEAVNYAMNAFLTRKPRL